MSKSAAFDNVKLGLNMVQKALARLGVLPHRTFVSCEDFREIFDDIEQIIIDVLARRRVRPNDPIELQCGYSGKKKMHTVKNTIITTMTKLMALKDKHLVVAIMIIRYLKMNFHLMQLGLNI